jgi:hypothetical protein
LEKAIQKGSELAIYSDWTLVAQERINKYRPGWYAGLRQMPLAGSEFFVTAPIQLDAGVAGKVGPATAPSAALASPAAKEKRQ